MALNNVVSSCICSKNHLIGVCKPALAQMLSSDALEAISEDDSYILTLAVIVRCDWSNDVTKSRHNPFTTSTSSAFAFYMFDPFYAVKSGNGV
ncbi:MAG: hypothetical protein AB2693_17525 [Candidatus Thiodiazotropha sp.]